MRYIKSEKKQLQSAQGPPRREKRLYSRRRVKMVAPAVYMEDAWKVGPKGRALKKSNNWMEPVVSIKSGSD
jgi:hypothetical protein